MGTIILMPIILMGAYRCSIVGGVSGEGLAPIVSAYSRLILVDGTVL